MKTTLEISDDMYRKVKVKAAMDGRTMKDLVAEGLAHVLTMPDSTIMRPVSAPITGRLTNAKKRKAPAWFGILAPHARRAGVASDMTSIRASIARGIVEDRQL